MRSVSRTRISSLAVNAVYFGVNEILANLALVGVCMPCVQADICVEVSHAATMRCVGAGSVETRAQVGVRMGPQVESETLRSVLSQLGRADHYFRGCSPMGVVGTGLSMDLSRTVGFGYSTSIMARRDYNLTEGWIWHSGVQKKTQKREKKRIMALRQTRNRLGTKAGIGDDDAETKVERDGRQRRHDRKNIRWGMTQVFARGI